ncbi:MAG: SusC/RagA family TonB-linked outer membrane protein [Ginsengibacter sp.]
MKMTRFMQRYIVVTSILLSCLCTFSANAQTNNADVKGIVRSEDGQLLPNASVIAKNLSTGFTSGAQTDSAGMFTFFKLPPNGKYSFTFSNVGYEDQTLSGYSLKAGESISIVVKMKDVSRLLDQVVVIGYGTQKKTETTGSISNVSGKEIADKPVTSFEGALAGRGTGINLIANDGVANQAPVFRIRGTNSLSLSSYPLVVVDGVPIYTDDVGVGGNAGNNPLASINPADIESIDIAKDAAATSIYGSRAANGVVFITTKSGKKGQAKFTYDGYIGQSQAVRLAPVLNASQYLEIKNEALKNAGTYDPVTNFYGTSIGPDGKEIDARWYDYIFRKANSQNHNISLSGGNDKTTYYFSLGYTKREGIVRGNGFDRKSVNYNLEHKVNSWLKVGTKTNYSMDNTSAILSTGTGVSSSSSNSIAYRLGFITAPIVGPYNADGTYNVIGPNVGVMDNTTHLTATKRLGYTNPVLSLAANDDNTANNFLQASAFVEIKPVSWVVLRTLYGLNNMYSRTERYFDPRTNEGQSALGSATGVTAKRETSVWTNTATISRSFKDNNLDLLLGYEESKFNGDQFGLTRTGQSDPFYTNIQGGFSNVAISNTSNAVYYNFLASQFSRLQYNYQRKYYLTGSFRRDQASVLGSKNKSGDFWGFSGAWQISKENFWEKSSISKVVNSLKISSSYGKVGNIAGVGDFASLTTYGASLYGGLAGLYYSSAGNENLKWETSKKLDVGLNLSLFDYRLTADISYYKNNIDGLIFSVPVPSSVGLPGNTVNSVLSNVGSMFNRGWEFALNGVVLRNKNINWNSNLNVSFNKNQVTALAPGVSSLLVEAGAGMVSISLPGYPVGMIYAIRTAGVDPATGRRIFLNKDGKKVLYQQVVPKTGGHQWEYEDGSIAPPVSTTDDAVIYKSPHPTVYGGFSNTFQFGNFDLGAMITYQYGGYIYFATQASLLDMRFQNNSTKVLGRWQKPGDITDIPRVEDGDITSWGYSTPLTANVYSSDFVRLKNVTFGYKLPQPLLKKIKIASIRVYVGGQNLAILTPYPGADPEVTSTGNATATQGFDKNVTPNARTYTVGLQITF